MSVFGTSLAQSVASTNQTQRVQTREKERAQRQHDPKRLKDAYEATHAEALERVRSLKDNTQEETHEDRREHDAYAPGQDSGARSVDLEG